MSKFIEVTAGTTVLINTEEIACVEPSKIIWTAVRFV